MARRRSFTPPAGCSSSCRAGTALNYSILSQFSIAGVGMYLAAAGASGCGSFPRVFGAAAYMFSGCMTARVVHLSIASGAALMPWALACVERAFREQAGARCRHSSRGAPGALAGRRPPRRLPLQVFAGHPQIPVYTALMLGLYALVRAIEYLARHGSAGWLCRLPLVVAGVYLLGGGLAAVQLVPWAEAGALSTRAAGASFDMVFNSSMARSEWLLQLFPYLYGSLRPGIFGEPPASPMLLVRFIEHSAYVGHPAVGSGRVRGSSPSGRSERLAEDRPPGVSLRAVLRVAGAARPAAGAWAGARRWRTSCTARPYSASCAPWSARCVLVDSRRGGSGGFGVQRLAQGASPAAWRRRWSLAAIGAGTAVLPVAIVLLARQAWFQQGMNLPQEATANLLLQRPNAAVPVLFGLLSGALFIWWSRRATTCVTLGACGRTGACWTWADTPRCSTPRPIAQLLRPVVRTCWSVLPSRDPGHARKGHVPAEERCPAIAAIAGDCWR